MTDQRHAFPIHSVACGTGAPIVLIHGALTTHRDWPATIIGPSAKLGRVFAIDRPGHGASRRPRYAAGADAQAKLIREGLQLDQAAVLVAHSFGALTALCYAEQFPDEVAAILLLAPVCFPEWRFEQLFLGPRAIPFVGPQLSAMAVATVDAGILALAQHQMFAPQAPPETWRAAHPLERLVDADYLVREGEDSLASSPLSPGAYRMTLPRHPITIVQGDADQIVPYGWHARMFKLCFRDTKLVLLNGVGHMVHHAEPATVVTELGALVAGRDHT